MNVRATGAGRGRRPSLLRDESGKSSMRGLVALLIVAATVYVGFKVLPVRTSAYRFNDAIRDEVIYAGSRRWNDDMIMQNLLDQATILGLPVTRGNITITRSGRKYIIVEADYTVQVEFIGGYRFDWHFTPRHEGPVF
jgi:hypothetical protein